MKLSKPQLTPVWYWFTEALTVFVNGCMSGIVAGGGTGVATGAATFGTELGDSMPTSMKIALSAISFAGSFISNGIKHFGVWHDKNRMPNPWPKPAEEQKQ